MRTLLSELSGADVRDAAIVDGASIGILDGMCAFTKILIFTLRCHDIEHGGFVARDDPDQSAHGHFRCAWRQGEMGLLQHLQHPGRHFALFALKRETLPEYLVVHKASHDRA